MNAEQMCPCGEPHTRAEARAEADRVQRAVERLAEVRAEGFKAGFAAGSAQALNDAAERIDRGPQIPLPPSIYSALCREWADSARAVEQKGGGE